MSNLDLENPPIDQDQARLAWSVISSAQNIGIISHRQPDPDSIGSNLALNFALSSLGKTIQSICIDAPPHNTHFLPKVKDYQQILDLNRYDLLISVDCGSEGQVAFNKSHPGLFEKNFINIDHHASNNHFGKINIVETTLSSTCEIVFYLLKYWRLSITREIATFLLFGLFYDTGSFMHSNVTPAVLEIASLLQSYGASHQLIINNLYKNFTESKYQIWGETLEKIKVTEQGIAVGVLSEQDFQKHRVSTEEVSGLIDYFSMCKESNLAALISQDKPGQIKGSLRTRKDTFNLSDMAGKMGGGGHKKASGFSFPGNIKKETIWKITN
ncbi:DHH family phosphoesterase [Candidatus Peregrinibacteria bacterium]|nr:DHH family phosphoesterase [Candidatus Peregrinibacteria bacterium]